MPPGYFGKHHQFAFVLASSAGLLWSQRSLDKVIKRHQDMEITLAANQLREESRSMHDLSVAQAKEEGRLEMDKFYKELKAKSEVIQCIPLGLVYGMMMALYTGQEMKKPGIKQSEKQVAFRAVDCNPVKEIQAVDGKGAECNK